MKQGLESVSHRCRSFRGVVVCRVAASCFRLQAELVCVSVWLCVCVVFECGTHTHTHSLLAGVVFVCVGMRH